MGTISKTKTATTIGQLKDTVIDGKRIPAVGHKLVTHKKCGAFGTHTISHNFSRLKGQKQK